MQSIMSAYIIAIFKCLHMQSLMSALLCMLSAQYTVGAAGVDYVHVHMHGYKN